MAVYIGKINLGILMFHMVAVERITLYGTNNYCKMLLPVLKGDVNIQCTDFESLVNKAQEGDVVYCDPTYSTKQRKQFDRYGKTIFSWPDQLRLAISAEKAMNRGALVIVSNSGCFQLNDFYPRAYRIEPE